jgi:acetyl-CoA carboxylase carboxyltransferase component
MYNPYTIIESVVDRGSWFEIGALWGTTGISGLARLGGRPVGVLSLNCEVNSGALDAMGSQKLMKMLKFCDVFNLPVVQFVDVREYLALLFPMLHTHTLSLICAIRSLIYCILY